MTVISKQSAPHYQWGDQCDGWHLVKTPTLSVIQERVPPGGKEVRHLHHHAEQFFFVLSGTATLEVDGTVYQLGENQGYHIGAGVPHQISNDTAEHIEFIVTSMPHSHGDRVLAPDHNA